MRLPENGSPCLSSSELDLPFPADRPANAVVEAAEVAAGEIVLVIARVEVVGDVEHLDADRRVAVRDADRLADLNVQRDELRITACAIPRAAEVPIPVEAPDGQTR